ncbi:MAG TPA: hypothetical protein VIX86_02105 [Streptosporangiaceae bacterium]
MNEQQTVEIEGRALRAGAVGASLIGRMLGRSGISPGTSSRAQQR